MALRERLEKNSEGYGRRLREAWRRLDSLSSTYNERTLLLEERLRELTNEACRRNKQEKDLMEDKGADNVSRSLTR